MFTLASASFAGYRYCYLQFQYSAFYRILSAKHLTSLKAAKYETKTFVAGWRKVLRKVERWSTLSNKFWLSCSLFIKLTTCHATNAAILDLRQANQPISALHFFNPQQMCLLQAKLITQGKKRETSTKTCDETMLREKLRAFVSRISLH